MGTMRVKYGIKADTGDSVSESTEIGENLIDENDIPLISYVLEISD